MMKTFCVGVAVLLGMAAIANGLSMLYAPIEWYLTVPGVTATGPFNQHFIRDIGLVFLFLGSAFLVGAARPQYRIMAWTAPTLWLWGHALFHGWEVAVGICGADALVRDFPGVTLSAVLGTLIAVWAFRDGRARAGPKAQ